MNIFSLSSSSPPSWSGGVPVCLNTSALLPICRVDTLDSNSVLQLDPAVAGVFGGPYPMGIDPVSTSLQIQRHLAS